MLKLMTVDGVTRWGAWQPLRGRRSAVFSAGLCLAVWPWRQIAKKNLVCSPSSAIIPATGSCVAGGNGCSIGILPGV